MIRPLPIKVADGYTLGKYCCGNCGRTSWIALVDVTNDLDEIQCHYCESYSLDLASAAHHYPVESGYRVDFIIDDAMAAIQDALVAEARVIKFDS